MQRTTAHRTPPRRYASHDLVRLYAVELGDAAERHHTTRRTVEHYAYSLVAAANVAAPFRARLDPGTPDLGVTLWIPADKTDAVAWFADEHDNIRAAFDLAEQEGLDRHLCLISWGINAFQTSPYDLGTGLVGCDEVILVGLRALAAAQRQGETWWLGYLNTALARGYIMLSQFDQSYRHYSAAADLGRETGDALRTATALVGTAGSLIDRPDWPSGADIERAAEMADEAKNLCDEIATTFERGSRDPAAAYARDLASTCESFLILLLFHRTGDVAATVAELGRVIDAHHSRGILRVARHLWALVGRVQEQVGDDVRAIEAYEQGLAVTPDLDLTAAEYMVSLAACQARIGDREAAARTSARARQLMDGVYDVYAEFQRARLDTLALDAD